MKFFLLLLLLFSLFFFSFKLTGMSETMSNPTEWIQFYSQTYSGQAVPPSSSTSDQPTLFPDRVSESPAVTAAVTGSSSPTAVNRSSPEGGRVSRPIRRRSRASRRTPTTLLNTDTTNFRAMVQQFTGGPSAPFAAAGSHHPAGFALGLGAGRQGFANPSAVMVPAAPAGYHHNFHLHHQQNLYQHQQQSQQYMFSGSAASAGAGHDNFFQRLSSGRPVSNMGVGSSNNTAEGFLLGSQAMAPAATATAARPNSSNSPNENRSNSFMF